MPTWLEGLRIDGVRGLRDALGHGVISAGRAQAWADTGAGPLAEGLRAALKGSATGWLWALGHMYATPDSSYQHPKATRLLLETAHFLKQVRGPNGLVLLLDEVENVTREHDIRGRRRCYETLGIVGGDPHVLLVLFVTPLFFKQCEADRAKGDSQWWAGWPMASRHFLSTVQKMERIRVPSLDDRLAERLVARIRELHVRAYPRRSSTPLGSEVLAAWRATATRSTRLLVRMAIQELDLQVQLQESRATNDGDIEASKSGAA